jgi:hypothetical protein
MVLTKYFEVRKFMNTLYKGKNPSLEVKAVIPLYQKEILSFETQH